MPVQSQDPMREVGDRHGERIVGVRRQVLERVLDQCHESRELVGGVALSMLENCEDALTEQ